ncbi:hypothetical protein C8Q77DRAFT_334781 [Trametes polyzona]|nr:hypothetical protein C8Q77DRAFT_334781 [Trametes polyzona]
MTFWSGLLCSLWYSDTSALFLTEQGSSPQVVHGEQTSDRLHVLPTFPWSTLQPPVSQTQYEGAAWGTHVFSAIHASAEKVVGVHWFLCYHRRVRSSI